MSYTELMRKHKVKSHLSDLTDHEREIFDAFIRLGETETDRRILGNAWLRHHAAGVIAWAK
jgi:hypothetical protein